MEGFVRALVATAALSMVIAGGSVHAMAANTGQAEEPKAGDQGPPATVGAMQNAAGNKATNPEDVRRHTEGKPTIVQEAQQGGQAATHPGMTGHAPGTVGAAPGATKPSGETARK